MLAVIAGPTASGKSAFAIEHAISHNGVIINADASQLYADLDIISARPDAADLARAPHRLYGVLDGADPATAARWADMAKAEIDRAWANGQLPILVGGTGMYLRLRLHGLADVPEIDPAIRAAVRALPVADAAQELAALDPVMNARLRPTDTTRIHRALEVVKSTGRSLADWQAATPTGLAAKVDLDAKVIIPDRALLYERCNARFEQMLERGALDEASRLAVRHLDPMLPVMKAVGLPPLLAHLRGEISLDQARVQAQQDTRNYAKRQMTWFRNQTPDWARIVP